MKDSGATECETLGSNEDCGRFLSCFVVKEIILTYEGTAVVHTCTVYIYR